MIAYPGGKVRLAQTIVSFLPKRGRTYCEPFAGRGSVFFAAASRLEFRRWWLNDIATAPFFEAILSVGSAVQVPPRSKEEYYRQWALTRQGDKRAIILEPYLTFGGGGYGRGGFGNKKGASQSGYTKIIRECHRLLHSTAPRITALDWQDMGLERLTGDDVVFLDPPYPDADVRSYTDGTVDHEALVDSLLKAKFRWLLCGYLHPILCRLGEPLWAKEMKLLSIRGEQQPRTECLWSNFAAASGDRRTLPPALNGRLRILADATSLSFVALDAKIDEGLETVAKDWNALVPYLLEMNRRLSAPGKRTDLRKGAPTDLTWTAWVESKRGRLGRSLRSVQRLLSGKTEASRERQAQPHDIVSRGSVDASEIPDSPMEIASEMARLVLNMRDSSRNAGSNKRRLEFLAEHFLRITGQ
jgi:site-specific DNA-adenine methylase